MKLAKESAYSVRVVALRWQLGGVKTDFLGELEATGQDTAASLFALARIVWPKVPRHQFALVGFHEKKPHQFPVIEE